MGSSVRGIVGVNPSEPQLLGGQKPSKVILQSESRRSGVKEQKRLKGRGRAILIPLVTFDSVCFGARGHFAEATLVIFVVRAHEAVPHVEVETVVAAEFLMVHGVVGRSVEHAAPF